MLVSATFLALAYLHNCCLLDFQILKTNAFKTPFPLIDRNAKILLDKRGILPQNVIPSPITTMLHARGPQREPANSRISQKRRQQLGIPDSEDEYDLETALDTNTDPLITKIIAGSFILVVIALLVVGIVIPSITDYGEGVCSPIQNAGRC